MMVRYKVATDKKSAVRVKAWGNSRVTIAPCRETTDMHNHFDSDGWWFVEKPRAFGPRWTWCADSAQRLRRQEDESVDAFAQRINDAVAATEASIDARAKRRREQLEAAAGLFARLSM